MSEYSKHFPELAQRLGLDPDAYKVAVGVGQEVNNDLAIQQRTIGLVKSAIQDLFDLWEEIPGEAPVKDPDVLKGLQNRLAVELGSILALAQYFHGQTDQKYHLKKILFKHLVGKSEAGYKDGEVVLPVTPFIQLVKMLDKLSKSTPDEKKTLLPVLAEAITDVVAAFGHELYHHTQQFEGTIDETLSANKNIFPDAYSLDPGENQARRGSISVLKLDAVQRYQTILMTNDNEVKQLAHLIIEAELKKIDEIEKGIYD